MRVMGGISISAAGVAINLRGRKARALLAFLALHPGKPIDREHLVGLFWSEVNEERARASLRQTVKELRQAFTSAALPDFDAERGSLKMEPGLISVDAASLMERLEAGDIADELLMAARPGDGLFNGFDDLDPGFRVWLLSYRQRWTDTLSRRIETLLEAAAQSGDRARLQRAALALLNLDPTHETACRHLMRLKMQAGDTAGALKVYNTLWQLLENEYDCEPSPETQSLVAQVKLGTFESAARPPQRAPAQARPDPKPAQAGPDAKPVLEVSPLLIADRHRVDEALLKCFRHELVACLTRFREWRIIDRPELPAGGAPADSRGGASDYEVELSAYPVNNSTALVLTLRSQQTASVVWSERFSLDAPNWFVIQRDVARRIAISLRVNISAERLSRLLPGSRAEISLHDRWIRGQALFHGYSADRFGKAEKIFSKLVADAPDFSPAYSSLAQLRNSRHLVRAGCWREPAIEAEALGFAGKAVQADPLDSRAHLCLAWSHAMAGNYVLAGPHFHSAAGLNENDPWTLTSAAQGLAFLGAHDEALALERKLLDASTALTRTQWAYLVGTRFLRGDYAGCVLAARQANDQISNLAGWTTAALALAGKKKEARAERERFFAMIRSQWTQAGVAAPDDADVTQWFLHNFPIRLKADWSRLRDGLHRAGSPQIAYKNRRLPHVAAG